MSAERSPYYEDDLVTLYHGDCRRVAEWLNAAVLVTDPPYGVKWHGATFGDTNYRASGKAPIENDSTTEARDWALAEWGERPALAFGSPSIPQPRHTRQVLVWHKPPNSGLMSATLGWRRDWEAIYVIGKWPTRRPAERSSVIQTKAGMRSYLLTDGHPHAKPVGLMVGLIEMCPPGMIADPFAGSGTTLVAAKQLGRRAIGVEVNERFCEMAAERLAQDVLDFGEIA